MTRPGTEIWLFHPMGQVRNEELKRVEDECKQRGWKFSRRQTRRISSSGGRVFRVVDVQDATSLYRKIHRARVGVWQIGKAQVSTSPELTPAPKRVITLRSFLMHKAFHYTLPEGNFQSAWYSSCDKFDEWMNQVGCEGEGDPRCLPLHIFKTKLDLSQLSTEEGRSLFGQTHGPQSSRVDANKLQWRRPGGPFHGRDALYVSGRSLAKGFHWDVSTKHATQRINTTSEIWEIRRGGYVNVYPDQHVRGGRLFRRVKLSSKRKAR